MRAAGLNRSPKEFRVGLTIRAQEICAIKTGAMVVEELHVDQRLPLLCG